MKRLLLLVSCFVCAGAFAQDADKAIESVKEKLALDDRTSVFDVKAVPTNGPTVLTGETSVPQAKEELLGMLKEQGIETIDAITLLPLSSSRAPTTTEAIRAEEASGFS